GTYTSRQAFIDGAVRKIGNRVDGMVVPEIVDILTEGDKLVFRWDGSGKMADGMPYHNRYSWAMTFKDGKVVEGTAYLDTALVDTFMDLPDS
ncbi:MAG: nuclear transport factor 2 family protein, partial [Pseudomonadota bacterium]|nr:nuclear transport factor 2 family protein [Pseudomonadota bacterium]